MNRLHRQRQDGQALVEFALIIIVLMMLIFFVVEASRILWAWNMAQNAARNGARYAITGQYEFDQPCFSDPTPCETDVARLNSIYDRVDQSLIGLQINDDPTAGLEDDNFLLRQVYGVQCFDANCGSRDFVEDFAGEPGQPVMVRVVYNVPIVTPILSNIVSNIRVVGQVLEQNELFNQLGGVTSGLSLPPDPPPAPTAGPSPTFTPSPTNTSTATPTETNTPTPGPSPTNTLTPSPTSTSTRVVCPTIFTDPVTDLVDGNNVVNITGDPNTTINLFNQTQGFTMVSGVLLSPISPIPPGLCGGFVQVTLPTEPPPGMVFEEGDVIIVSNNDDGTADAFTVRPDEPTPTPSNTPTLQPTATATNTQTPTPPPLTPYIVIIPSCVVGPNISFTIQGGNWPTGTQINLFWESSYQQPITTATGFFTQQWSLSVTEYRFFTVRAVAATGETATTQVQVDNNCGFVTPLPATPTSTPLPPDLIIVGLPSPLITRPLAENTPVAFQIVISNTGEVAINSQFFVDLYLDPSDEELENLPDYVDINASSGYMAVSSLGPLASRTLTVTAELGFTGGLTTTRAVYGMVDSLRSVFEADEMNNVSGPLPVDDVTPGPTPTTTPTPSGTNSLSGIVRILLSSWVPQFRARVYLYDVDQGSGMRTYLRQTTTDTNGFYGFTVDNPPANHYYEVVSCITVDSVVDYTGQRTGLLPGNNFADIFMLQDPGGCPAP